MGMGVALVLDRSQLADPRIGLAQAHAALFSQNARSRAPLSGLASVGNMTAFGCIAVSITAQARSEGFIASVRRHRQALLQQRFELLSPHPLASTRQRRTVEHQRMLEKLPATEVLEVWILHLAISSERSLVCA
jgi:hypothetical protein